MTKTTNELIEEYLKAGGQIKKLSTPTPEQQQRTSLKSYNKKRRGNQKPIKGSGGKYRPPKSKPQPKPYERKRWTGIRKGANGLSTLTLETKHLDPFFQVWSRCLTWKRFPQSRLALTLARVFRSALQVKLSGDWIVVPLPGKYQTKLSACPDSVNFDGSRCEIWQKAGRTTFNVSQGANKRNTVHQ